MFSLINTAAAVALVAAALTGAGVGARTAAAPQSQASSEVPGKITVTGCVERADQVVDRTTLGTTVDSLTFVLVEGGVRGATGEMKVLYTLDAEIDTINPHVGHQVEVRGTAAGPAASASNAGAAAAARTLKVEQIRKIAETCPR
jgi:hypothetical protein